VEREYWVMMRYDKSGSPVEYYAKSAEYMPESNPHSRTEVYDGPFAAGWMAARVVDAKNAELERAS